MFFAEGEQQAAGFGPLLLRFKSEVLRYYYGNRQAPHQLSYCFEKYFYV